jgi:hypothetical protein
MGQSHRIGHLRRALAHMRARGGDAVWFTTAGAVDEAFRALGPEEDARAE